MNPCYQDSRATLYQGDCREVLRELPEQSVHTCITSPPYWHLRDYKVEEQIGLEATVPEYLDVLTSCFREVWRVLRDTANFKLAGCKRPSRRCLYHANRAVAVLRLCGVLSGAASRWNQDPMCRLRGD